MNPRSTLVLAALGAALMSGTALGAKPSEPTRARLTAALTRHLARHGDLCLGKFDWPIDVSTQESEVGTRDAIQMPVLEKLGLVASTSESALRKRGDVEESVPVKRYALTDAGRKYYLDKKLSSAVTGDKTRLRQGDFCAGKVSLAKLVAWEKPVKVGDFPETNATYTYTFAAAPWTSDAEIQRVFPMVARILKGEGELRLQQRLRFDGKQWVGVNPWD